MFNRLVENLYMVCLNLNFVFLGGKNVESFNEFKIWFVKLNFSVYIYIYLKEWYWCIEVCYNYIY